MIKKRQVSTMVSIAVISFLLGTMLNMNFVASGGKGKDKDELWTAISELQSEVDSLNASLVDLQNRVSTIEEKGNQVKKIRFYEPHEKMTNQSQYVDVATFIWTPNNSTNNAILRINLYFTYRTETGNKMLFRIAINDESCGIMGWLESPAYKQSLVYSHSLLTDIGLRITPNQNNYTLRFQLTSFYSGAKAYAKDINIVLEVVDGLPTSN